MSRDIYMRTKIDVDTIIKSKSKPKFTLMDWYKEQLDNIAKKFKELI